MKVSLIAFRKMLSFLTVLTVCVLALPAIAFAQTGGAPSPVTPAVAIVTILSVVLGFVTQGIQSGSFLGVATVPKSWLPDLTLFGTFLGGVVAYVSGLGANFIVSGSVAYYAVMAGLTALLAGAAPGLAQHAHVVVPNALKALRSQGGK